MEKVFVAKTGISVGDNFTSIDDIMSMVKGEVGMLQHYDNGKQLAFGEEVLGTDGIPAYVQLILGMGTNVLPRMTTPLFANAFKVTRQSYQAGVAMVAVFGNDGLVAKTSGNFTSSNVGETYKCTRVGPAPAGDGKFGTYLINSKGVAVANGTGLTLNEEYTVVGAGTPTWNSAVLTPTSINKSLVVSSLTVGMEYGVTIVDLTKDVNQRNKWDITLPIKDVTITNAQMLTNLVAAINAHPTIKNMGTATVIGSTGFKFVASDYTKIFTILPIGVFAGTDISVAGEGLSIMPVPPIGSYEEVLESEFRGSFGDGRVATADKYRPIWKVEANAEEGVNYDCISITQKHLTSDRGYPNAKGWSGETSLVIYYNTSESADYDALYNALVLYSGVNNSAYQATADQIAEHALIEAGTNAGDVHPGA